MAKSFEEQSQTAILAMLELLEKANNPAESLVLFAGFITTIDQHEDDCDCMFCLVAKAVEKKKDEVNSSVFSDELLLDIEELILRKQSQYFQVQKEHNDKANQN
jgi:hypothetical protein